ncbi:MAG TPA: TRAP transporter small permease subunit, partial [Firmicutes bacterium]|nr:TRAP transporter small permease subunit [Bacillota bacterium]
MVDPVVETGKKPGMAASLERAGNGVNRIFHPIAEKVCFVAMFLVLLMVAAVALDVILRAAKISLPAISEAVTYMMGFLTFLSLAYVGSIKGHISIDLFLEKLSAGKKGAMVAAHNIMGFVLVCIFIWQFIEYALRNTDLQGKLIQISL